VNRETADGARV